MCVFVGAESAYLPYFLCSPFPHLAYGGYINNLCANTLMISRLLKLTHVPPIEAAYTVIKASHVTC